MQKENKKKLTFLSTFYMSKAICNLYHLIFTAP